MDIDLDLKTDFDPLEIFKGATRASMVKNQDLVKHNVGVYFQTIPVDAMTGLAAIPYKDAERLNYFKIDFLHLSLLDYFESKEEIKILLNKDPDWKLLQNPEVVKKLFQVHNHFDLLQQVQPNDVETLADVIAMLRPRKRGLLKNYLRDRKKVRPFLYRQDDEDKSSFKKGHAIAYSLNVVLQLHLIKAGIM